jgi:Calcineurin-like phosphoesterase
MTVFVGDLIDRGPEQFEVLDAVRRMVDAGYAQVVLGNHEFNAMGYAVRDPATGRHLRPRSEKNRSQHAAFLAAVGEDSTYHWEWVDWFRHLPLPLDLGGIRVVHA